MFAINVDGGTINLDGGNEVVLLGGVFLLGKGNSNIITWYDML